MNRAGARGANLQRPPTGPVGRPVRNAGLPANAIGRQNVKVPGNLVNHPVRTSAPAANPANRPNLNPGSRPRPSGERPQFAGQGGQRSRPDIQRPSGGGFTPRPQGERQPGQFQRPNPSAFGGMGEGNRAAAFGQRGAQSRQPGGFHPQQAPGGFRGGGGGGFHGGFHGRR